MCSFVPDNFDSSPDRVDALVWALTELMVDPEPQPGIRFPDIYPRTGRPTGAYQDNDMNIFSLAMTTEAFSGMRPYPELRDLACLTGGKNFAGGGRW